MFGTGPFTIDDITNNVVILLRHHAKPDVAVMNLDISEARSANARVEEFIRKYFDGARLEDDTYLSNSQALVIGGEFRENIQTPAGEMIVHVHYDLARKSAEEALQLCKVTPQYIPADNDHSVDMRMTKKLVVKKDGKWKVTGKLKGLNKFESVMSQDTYELTIGRYRDS